MIRTSALIISVLLIATELAYSFDRAELHSYQVPVVNRSTAAPTVPATLSPGLSASTDWLVSQSISPSTFDQNNMTIIPLKSGNYLAAWDDDRLGARKVFWQQIDSTGLPVGDNQLVASSEIGSDLVDPKLGEDTLGRVFLFYRDKTGGLVYGSRYDENLTVSQSAYLVNDTSAAAYGGLFDVSVYPDGRLVVVWENYNSGGSTIAMGLYNKDGVRISGPSTVNSDGGASSHWAPSVAVDPNGNFVVGWEDYRNSQADIYIRSFNGSGSSLGADLAIVPPNFNLSAQFTPEVAFSPTDQFAIGWVDQRDGQEIFMQRFSATSGLVGGNVQLSGPDNQVVNWDPDFTVSPSNRLQATWASFGAENNIMLLNFDTGFTPLEPSQPINLSTTGQRWDPSACFRHDGEFAVGWTDVPDGSNDDIYLMLFDAGGASSSPELTLNEDATGAVSSNPVIVQTDDWYNIVAFVDQRNDEGDIFCQAISNSGVLLAANVRVNQDAGRSIQSDPAAASFVGDDRALVTWVDSRDVGGIPGQRIYGRFCNHWGVFSENEFMISDSAQTAVKSDVAVAIDGMGRGLVAWADQRNGNPQVYGRWLKADGTADGAEFTVSNPANDSANSDIHIGVDGSDRFFIVWLDRGVAETTAKIRRMTYGGSASLTFSWSSTTTGVHVNDLSAGVDLSGNISLLWNSVEAVPKLYLTVLGNTGTVLRTPFVISDNVAAIPTQPGVSVGSSGYVSATWVDHRDGKRVIYYQLLDNSYIPIDVNNRVSSTSPEIQQNPSTSTQFGRAWYTWADSRSNGFNIYANNLVYLPTDANDGGDNLPESFGLSQNYPNPFNPSTEISFSLPVKSQVSLVIYNMLGQQVRSLVNTTLSAGEHRVVWDGTEASGKPVASGIYLYRLEAGGKAMSKKMELLK